MKKHRLETQNNLTHSTLRKARTRTLIQLGGLVEKSGLMEFFGLEPGDDLQQNLEKKEEVFALLGSLLETQSMLENGDLHKDLLAQKGAKVFSDSK
jgi:hypothetical protein